MRKLWIYAVKYRAIVSFSYLSNSHFLIILSFKGTICTSWESDDKHTKNQEVEQETAVQTAYYITRDDSRGCERVWRSPGHCWLLAGLLDCCLLERQVSSTRIHTENIQHFFPLVVSECNLRMLSLCVVAARSTAKSRSCITISFLARNHLLLVCGE